MARRLPAPWTAERIPGGYVVRDATGQAVAYVYARETRAEADTAKVLTMDEARRVAANIAKLPALLSKATEEEMTKIDTYGDYKRSIVEEDLDDFLKHRDDLRLAWHCAGSLFHLTDWVYAAHKPAIDAKYTYVDDHGVTKPVSRVEHFANSLGQKHPNFQLIRGIANASKHFFLKPVPAGRTNPPGMPSHAANTYVSGAAFQYGAFQSNAFQTGDVTLEADQGDIEFAPLAQSVMDMWNNLLASEGW